MINNILKIFGLEAIKLYIYEEMWTEFWATLDSPLPHKYLTIASWAIVNKAELDKAMPYYVNRLWGIDDSQEL